MNRRLDEHNSGKTKSLVGIRPLKLVFEKEFLLLHDARRVEKNLKRLKNRRIIEQIVKDGEIKGFAGMV